jgi:hypothetical protein
MIFISAKFQVRPEDAGQWPQIAPQDGWSLLGELAIPGSVPGSD